MKKKFLFALLLGYAQVACAEPDWIEYYLDNTEGNFFDKGSLVRKGNLIEVWTMANFVSPKKLTDGRTYSSTKFREIVDCARRVTRTTYGVAYDGSSGDGAVVVRSTSFDGNESPVVPGTIQQALVDAVCKLGKGAVKRR